MTAKKENVNLISPEDMMKQEAESAQAFAKFAEVVNIQRKIHEAKNVTELSFIIVNETQKLIPYDLAILFKNDDGKYKILNISGQSEFSKTSNFAHKIEKIACMIEHPDQQQVITNESLTSEVSTFEEYCASNKPSILWQPIVDEDKKVLYGLWIESWENKKYNKGQLNILSTVCQSYATVSKRFHRHFFSRRNLRYGIAIASLLTLFALCFLPISLRVVAPCELVPLDPYIITTPLSGRLDHIITNHGQEVNKGDLLFSYNKEIPIHQLRMKQKEYEVAAAKLAKAENTSHTEPESLQSLQSLILQAEKSNIDVEMLQYQIQLMDVTSPISGKVEIEKPEQWRGKNVDVGEKVMTVYNDKNTFIKIQIPYDDRIDFDWDRPIKVFLNPTPEKSYPARLTYISSFTIVTEKQTIVFLAEAEWIEKNNLKVGLKGSAILYGDKVPLIYWLLRKPLNTFREIIGF